MEIRSIADLEEALSRPSEADCALLRRIDGDILILGSSGKMGPSLARLCRRATDAVGKPRRIVAVSRHPISEEGVEAISCDLLDRDRIGQLPECPNVLYLVGRKFGSSGRPDLTWAMNTVAPAFVADRFRRGRIVVFSSGNVYPFRALDKGGSRETDAPDPVGEYAQSALGRERVFEYYSNEYGLRCVIFRLNYAVDLRYGVLVDIAKKVYNGEPVGLAVPAFNVIWQRDANSYGLRSLELCDAPPTTLNVTGSEICTVRGAAEFFATRFKKSCRYEGTEGPAALLSDASMCHKLLGAPEVSLDLLLNLVADWVERGGESLNKPTHFEVADGKF